MIGIESVSAVTYVAPAPAPAAEPPAPKPEETTSEATAEAAPPPPPPEAETNGTYNTVGNASNSTIRGTGVSVVV